MSLSRSCDATFFSWRERVHAANQYLLFSGRSISELLLTSFDSIKRITPSGADVASPSESQSTLSKLHLRQHPKSRLLWFARLRFQTYFRKELHSKSGCRS